jgi:hypothetical protein
MRSARARPRCFAGYSKLIAREWRRTAGVDATQTFVGRVRDAQPPLRADLAAPDRRIDCSPPPDQIAPAVTAVRESVGAHRIAV